MVLPKHGIFRLGGLSSGGAKLATKLQNEKVLRSFLWCLLGPEQMVNMVFQASGHESHEIENTHLQGEFDVRASGLVTKEPDMYIEDKGPSSFLGFLRPPKQLSVDKFSG